MALDLWSHQFCLACDKQVETNSAAHCSEACRLTELEKTATPSSQASSPGLTPSSYPWSTSAKHTTNAVANRFYLSPPYDFGNAQPYGNSSPQQQIFGNYNMSGSQQTSRTLTPSSSHASLCSMQSTSSSDSTQLSDRARQELRAYAVSFEHVREHRRRSA